MVTGPVLHVGGQILPPGCPKVLINKKPAACVGDKATCIGPNPFAAIVRGSLKVMINGKPAARMGYMTAHGGAILLGYPFVLIGG
jgi:uncharacterized Zn-binding protein involved in type VI secretion